MFLISSETVETAFSEGSASVAPQETESFSAVLAVTNSAPAAGNFTATAATDLLTLGGPHGYLTGLKVQVSNSGGGLPAGLSTATDYFVIKLGEGFATLKLATNLANAQAGTAIDITSAGTGVHTVTPTALAGASAKLQCSNDGSVWADVPISASGDATKSASITASVNIVLSEKNITSKFYRVYYTLTAGQLSIVHKTAVKG